MEPHANLALTWVPAGRKRRLLAAFVDLVLFSALWGIVDFFGRVAFPPLSDMPLYGRFFVFLALELVLQQWWSWSPGFRLLSMRALPAERAPFPVVDGSRYVLVADARIVERENWLTIVLGILFINDGAKGLVRWSLWNPPVPVFGLETDAITSAVISALLGLVEILVGASFLRLKFRAFWIGLLVQGATLSSTVLSWRLWDSFVADLVVRRRAHQGLPLRVGEIETLQGFIPEGFVVWSLFLMAAIVFTWKPLSKP